MIGTYVYDDIDYNNEIRILCIMPGRSSANLRCVLAPALLPSRDDSSMKQSPRFPFIALSYTWGTDDPTNIIFLSKETSNASGSEAVETGDQNLATKYVSNNLMAALLHLRSETEVVKVWADAICINQNSTTEKTVQISRMEEVYSQAEKVCIWLGEPTISEEAVETKKAEVARQTFDLLKSISDTEIPDQVLMQEEYVENWELIIKLIRKDWFSRRWIVQELALAANAWIRYGDQEMPWQDFAHAVTLFMAKFPEIQRSLKKPTSGAADGVQKSIVSNDQDPRGSAANALITAMKRLFRRAEDGGVEKRLLTMEALVTSYLVPFESTDPRDTIFAALSMASDTSKPDTDPTTRQKLTRLWRKYTARMVSYSGIFWPLTGFSLALAYFHWNRTIYASSWILWLTSLSIALMCAFLLQVFPPSSKSMKNPFLTQTLDPRLQPDYKKPVLDVYADFIETTIEKSHSIDIIVRSWAASPGRRTMRDYILSDKIFPENGGLPSWISGIATPPAGVPRQQKWHIANENSFVDGSLHKKQYNASRGSEPRVKFIRFDDCDAKDTSSLDPPPEFTGILEVEGFQLDIIAQTSYAVNGGVIPSDALEMGGWNKDRHKEKHDVPEALWRTLCGDRGPGGIQPPNWYRRACKDFLEVEEYNYDGDIFTNHLKENTEISMVREFVDRVQSVVCNRRFFLTRGATQYRGKRLYGLGPKQLREGDVICILLGCTVPVVLRRDAENQGNSWKLIGGCFVYSMMDGEAMERKWEKRTETFNTPNSPDLSNNPAAATANPVRDRLRAAVKIVIPPKKGNYVYRDINYNKDIRVLKIIPDRPAAKLRCLVATIALAETTDFFNHEVVPYCALSYYWGTDEAKNEILIHEQPESGSDTNGNENILLPSTWQKTYIQKNLMAALKQIRSQKDVVVLWVDALCINQESPVERSAQVARMHAIYTHAQKVCIWLGDPSMPDDSDRAQRTFKVLRKILDLDDFHRLIASGEKPEDWMLIIRLMKNEWFGRRWIIQELALSANPWIRYGSEEMKWRNAADAIALFMTSFPRIKDILIKHEKKDPDNEMWEGIDVQALDARALGANTLVTTTNRLFRRANDNGHIEQRSLTLEILVSSLLLPFEAKDPRDTVFAVLSVAKDTWNSDSELEIGLKWERTARQALLLWGLLLVFEWGFWSLIKLPLSLLRGPSERQAIVLDPRIRPDYQKSLLDVYADFMEYCIDKSQSLDILLRNWAPMAKETLRQRLDSDRAPPQIEMPSWVPDIKWSPFGPPDKKQIGRMYGDSFVDGSDRQKKYNASLGRPPRVRFGKFKKEAYSTSPSASTQRSVETSQQAQQLPPKFTGTLEVDGFELDLIGQISDAVNTGVIPASALEMGGWNRDLPKEDRVLTDELWRTMCGDRGPGGVHAPNWYRAACLFCLQETLSHEGNLRTNDIKPAARTDVVLDFIDRVQTVVWQRRFFRTSGTGRRGRKSLFGLAPQSAKEGDVICILLGCTVPVVLRQQGGNKNSWKLVGECFVFSMMDGEAISGDWPKTLCTFRLN
ncbi:heterokaryon incompatibility -domain-containing protein [Rutstroemia sp. NJR-2017a BVV2]|nr:heterokaryon incompatibility -domain-containing protein [Rutstroemia sp. NJR-2017a BVV2]